MKGAGPIRTKEICVKHWVKDRREGLIPKAKQMKTA